MQCFQLPVAKARRIAEIHFTTLEQIIKEGGHIWLPDGAKLIVTTNKKCHIISHKYDNSDLDKYKHLEIMPLASA
jgi:hypothetical protein